MRITAEEKAATRSRILDVARRLFAARGFDQATIRDIARDADMAVGTLFNYFPSKEEVAVALADFALGNARQDFAKRRRANASLEEDLFLQISTQLRALKPLRKFIGPVVDSALSSPTRGRSREAKAQLWADELDALAEILHGHRIDADRWTMTVPIYWALYVGVLSFWGRDKSPRQEDTLAMLDQATKMFVAWLETTD